MIKFEQLRKIHVELTTRCNARCPMCMRNYRGYEHNSGYPDCELTLTDFKKIITPDVISHIMQPTDGVKSDNQGVNFNGNLGDFASARDSVEIVEYLVKHGVRVNINTNGSLRNTRWWQRLALPGVQVGFALDGLADTHSLYRQDTNWHKIIENACAFIEAGGQAVWRFIPFDHNQHQENQCRELANELGFTKFENIYDGRDRTPVYTRQGEFSHHIGKPYPGPVPGVRDLLKSHITWFDVNTVRSSKDSAILNLSCTHKMNREIYIAADGTVYPCCYLGFYPATMAHPGNSQLQPLVQENNALEHSLEHCMQWFDQVEQTWGKKSIADGRLYHCVNNCGRT
jgi:MoaA/NifB/PqqE/SkfB family radical SAM enzyme